MAILGIRREDKNQWERRAPLTPEDVGRLVDRGVEVRVEPSVKRVFQDGEYAAAGAGVADDLAGCDLVLGIKEMPPETFRPGGAYLFFSHTMKGQAMNMPMLARLKALQGTLFDYELIKDAAGRRLVFFGRHAGWAGMADSLWTLGRRLEVLGHPTPLLDLEPAHAHADLGALKDRVAAVGEAIRRQGLPAGLDPVVVGITGYGNVSQGAQEILDLLPVERVEPEEVERCLRSGERHKVFKAVYRERHLVAHRDRGRPFDLREYYDHPEFYRSTFAGVLPHLTLLVNAIYWDERYPRLATREALAGLGPDSRLVALGDISCDIDGALASTVRETDPGDPVYIYDPSTGAGTSGFTGPGLAVMAVYNLPCELPREATASFSAALSPFLEELVSLDYTADLDGLALSPPLRGALLLWRGRFTPEFAYMQEFLDALEG